MSELALAPIPASSLLFPATAKFRLIETQLPVVGARTVATRDGVLGDSGGRRGQPAVVRRGTNICARVLVLDLPSHQLRGSEIVLCVGLRWVELVGEHRESGSTKSGRRVHSRRELLLEVTVKELLQRSGFTERSRIRSRMLMSRTEGLSLYSGNSRILWHNHIVQLLSVSGGESWDGVLKIGLGGHDILKLLIEATCGLRLTECRVRWSIVHAGLTEGVPWELSLWCTVIHLEILLIAARERGEGGLIAMGPILAVGRWVSSFPRHWLRMPIPTWSMEP